MIIDWKRLVKSIIDQESANRYGYRNDGSPKGFGYYGELPGMGPNSGSIMTENTIGVNFDGIEQEIPTIIPTLTNKELKIILSGGMNNQIVDKSVEHARKRLSQGMSPFAGPKDLIIPSPKFKGRK